MKLAIMQPYFLPYIGYWQLINSVDKFVVLDDVNYINRGWINRNRILVNGSANLFTIPLIAASQNRLICDIQILEDEKWRNKLLKTVELQYKKAPCFDKAYQLVESVVLCLEFNLSKYILNSILQISDYLGIKTAVEPTSAKYSNSFLKGAERIMDVCLQEKATAYYNPIGGAELYEKMRFAEKGVELFFLQASFREYNQHNNIFVPWLSIIDVMMFNSASFISNNLNDYRLL